MFNLFSTVVEIAEFSENACQGGKLLISFAEIGMPHTALHRKPLKKRCWGLLMSMNHLLFPV